MYYYCYRHERVEPTEWTRADHKWIGPYETYEEAAIWRFRLHPGLQSHRQREEAIRKVRQDLGKEK